MKAKHVSGLNTRIESVAAFMLKSENWQGNVLNIQEDDTLDPGASPAEGDRYVIQVAASLHANFGTINEKFTGYDQEGDKTHRAAPVPPLCGFCVVVLGHGLHLKSSRANRDSLAPRRGAVPLDATGHGLSPVP